MIRPTCNWAKARGLGLGIAPRGYCTACKRDAEKLARMARGHQVTALAAEFQNIREMTSYSTTDILHAARRLKLSGASEAIGGPNLYALLKY